MTDEELAQRLRDIYGGSAELIVALEKSCKEWADVSQQNYQRAKVAEYKLAKAVKAMQEAIKLADMPHYGDREDALDNCFDAIVLLRTALSELNGDKT